MPDHDAALRFAVALLDEAFDELGLYLVHHNRWVVAARDNDAGARLAAELRPLLGPLAAGVRRSFPARQVRRLPYLLSVADPEDASFADLSPRLRPPARAGSPPTHALLDEAFAALLAWTLGAFVPLAQQNHAAWARHRAAGETLWNERAFDRGRALYDGVLLGRPFRSVAKTFQVRVWAELRSAWQALAPADRARLPLPGGGALDHDGPPPY